MEVCHVTYSATTFTWRLVGLPIKNAASIAPDVASRDRGGFDP